MFHLSLTHNSGTSAMLRKNMDELPNLGAGQSFLTAQDPLTIPGGAGGAGGAGLGGDHGFHAGSGNPQ